MIFILGTLPPPIGGTTIICSELKEATLNSHDYMFFDLRRQFFHLLICLFLSRNSPKTICINCSSFSFFTFLPLYLFLLRFVTQASFSVRLFGGDFQFSYLNKSFLPKLLFKFYKQLDLTCLFLETSSDISFAKTVLPSGVSLYALPNYRQRVVVDPFENKLPLPPHAKLQIVYAGRVSYEKGISSFYELDRLLDPNLFEISVYGPISNRVSSSFFDPLSLVKYKGIVDNTMIQQVLAQYHVLLFPTIHTGEGHPGILLEACMSALALVAPPRNSFNDFLYSEAIYEINPINPITIVNALCDLQESPSKLRYMMDLSYESSLNKFPSSTTSERLLSILSSDL